ncbi:MULTISPECIES: GbsR/MarR family transcriptional regulator [Allobacillus]|uniref:HTH-type transcriptional regulator n=1 Tax=Allobacillus halotolerans TaxID=570278 RepID=A0ABS6GSG6_9BACI|nr:MULTISPECIES: GbsR/MarR family transcriptional regulator [Allobacillus]MBU6081624.1 GbsR/MarR family transcriptional regulator [Allobacillus halotolerans]TSJ66330.1 GbsR/MarR family transcriptional regulator [Allobacillus sp. SKP2-8]
MTDDRQNNQDWKDYEELIERYIQVIAKNMNLYGITPSVGRLYGTLYFAEEPMTLDQMRDALLMSKTSMSTGVKALADMKMVTPTFRKGIRKDLYQTEKDWYKSFTSLFTTKWRRQTENNLEEAEEAMRQLEKLQEETTDPALKETIQSDIQKLEYSYEYYEWLIRFVRVVETGEIFDYVPRKPKK